MERQFSKHIQYNGKLFALRHFCRQPSFNTQAFGCVVTTLCCRIRCRCQQRDQGPICEHMAHRKSPEYEQTQMLKHMNFLQCFLRFRIRILHMPGKAAGSKSEAWLKLHWVMREAVFRMGSRILSPSHPRPMNTKPSPDQAQSKP